MCWDLNRMSLNDITNVFVDQNDMKGITKRKRLSNGQIKQYNYAKPRKQFEIVFTSDAEKLLFEERIEHIKKDNQLKTTKELFEYFMKSSESISQTNTKECMSSKTDLLLNNSKTGMFICENKCIFDLVDKIRDHQEICEQGIQPTSLDQSGHVAELSWKCSNEHTIKWSSSSELGTNYSVNYKMMMAYLCSGITQIQYERFASFADFGVLTDYFRVQSAMTYSAIINVLANESVQFALLDEVQISNEKNEDGITVMTDARHHCRKNSYHTDHVALGAHTHKVINIQHLTKEQERCTQKHETIGCEQMYDYFKRKNVKVNIHAHNRNLSVNKSIRTKENVKNCNEKWHATKQVTQGMKKISSGAKKNIGKTWHPELADKASRVRNHLYYAIDNCGNDPTSLRKLIDNCIYHFEDNHEQCANDSHCKTPGYVPDFIVLRTPIAITLLSNFLHSLTLYKYAEDYALSKDTYYVESFNNSCLIYLDKRIHYKDMSYKTRIDLATLSWNEHVDRPFTSRNNRQQVQHNRRNLGKKAYKKKTYNFVNDIWSLLISVKEDGHLIPGYIDRNVEDIDHYDEEI